MKRKIVKIHEEKCNGCGECVTACHESAIEIVDGVAKLVSDIYCDGLGDCLSGCPTDAIEIIERDADEYSQEAVDKRVEVLKSKEEENKMNNFAGGSLPCGCPGTHEKTLRGGCNSSAPKEINTSGLSGSDVNVPSQLRQWPIQMMLINPRAPFLQNADLLIAADCTAYAYGNFHSEFMKDKVTIIMCPKLDDNNLNTERILEIIQNNDIRSITVARMEVPCCGGTVSAAKTAIQMSGKIVPYAEVTISSDGRIVG
jgi:Pyruvate/2-oxoacid:ferredoxin oxidoreductase delta subunit